MMRPMTAIAAFCAVASAADAGGIDRTTSDFGVLFEEGNYLSFGFTDVNTQLSGDYPAALGGGTSGDMSGGFSGASMTVKLALTDRLDLAFVQNQPYGADASYPAGFYTGLMADWESHGSTLMLRYAVSDGFSVFGGARQVRSEARIAIPDQLIRAGLAQAGQAGNAAAAALAAGAPAGTLAYTAETSADTANTMIAGIAYERPEIALRVALSYEQGFSHDFDTVETLPAAGILGASSVTNIDMPEVWTLDAQTGIAPGTLLFGSVRHATWSDWQVEPPAYFGLFGDEVTGFDNDVTTYRVGLGRELTEDLSMFVRATYEESKGGEISRLAPIDGTRAIAVGGRYSFGNSEVSAGIEYQQLGDVTIADGTTFEGGEAMGYSVSFATRF